MWTSRVLFSVCCALWAGSPSAGWAERLPLLPYPKEIEPSSGRLLLGPTKYVTAPASETERVARESLDRHLPRQPVRHCLPAGQPSANAKDSCGGQAVAHGKAVTVHLGSVEEGYRPDWLAPRDRQFLADPKTSPEASVLTISPDAITVVGKGKWGMLYGVQSVNQLIRGTETSQGLWKMNASIPCLTIRDWPDMAWRCLSPQMTWYSGYNRLEGYGNGNWTLDEWKWLVDWSLLHKCNGWALCMYGNWPFTLPGYEETTLDVDSFFHNPATGKKERHRFTHRNIKREFLPELIRYANQRGVKIYAYLGKNTFNGTYGLKHPDANAGGVELRYLHGGDTRSATIPFGISGVYLLRLPAFHVTPGKPLNLAVRVPPVGGADWFMVHEYRDLAEATADASVPYPRKPAIAAFTPHLDGKFGVTIAEFTASPW
jgi:hypothetical protein